MGANIDRCIMSSPGSPGKPMLHPHTSHCISSGSFEQSDKLNTSDTSNVDVATIAVAEAPTTPTSVADTARRTRHPEEHLDQDLSLSPGVRQNVKESCADLHFLGLVKANGELCAYTIISQIDEDQGKMNYGKYSFKPSLTCLTGHLVHGETIQTRWQKMETCMWGGCTWVFMSTIQQT